VYKKHACAELFSKVVGYYFLRSLDTANCLFLVFIGLSFFNSKRKLRKKYLGKNHFLKVLITFIYLYISVRLVVPVGLGIFIYVGILYPKEIKTYNILYLDYTLVMAYIGKVIF